MNVSQKLASWKVPAEDAKASKNKIGMNQRNPRFKRYSPCLFLAVFLIFRSTVKPFNRQTVKLRAYKALSLTQVSAIELSLKFI
jgi:hypothetical protein